MDAIPKTNLKFLSHLFCHLQMLSIWTSVKFDHDKILDHSKLKAFADDIMNKTSKLVLGRVENIVGG